MYVNRLEGVKVVFFILSRFNFLVSDLEVGNEGSKNFYLFVMSFEVSLFDIVFFLKIL